MKKDNVYQLNTNTEQVESEEKKRAPQGSIKILVVGLVVIVLLFVIVRFGRNLLVRMNRYEGYEVTHSTERTDASAMEYLDYSGSLVHYSKEGISYLDKQGNVVWNESYTMKMPKAAVEGEYVGVADLNGNDIVILNKSGRVGMLSMPYSICDFDISKQGVVAAVLKGENENYIYLYSSSGDVLVEMKTTINKSGYPIDIALSPDGSKLMASYVYLEGVEVKNTIAAYNFGSVGQNEVDRLVGGFNYDDTIFPKLEFLNDNTVCAFGDNRIVVFSMKEKAVEKCNLTIEQEIKSVMYSSEYIGVVMNEKNGATDYPYTMQIFNLSGHKVNEEKLDIPYHTVTMNKEEVIFTGDNECAIYYVTGGKKFDCHFTDNNIEKVIATANAKEYITVSEREIAYIKLRKTK